MGSPADFYQTAPCIAAQGGFSGYYSYDIEQDLAQGVEQTKRCFETYGLTPVGFRIPVELDATCAAFQRAFTELPHLLETARAVGYQTALTWIAPGSNHATPIDYHTMLVSRLQRLAGLLATYQMQLVVELAAPYTLAQQYRFPIPVKFGYLLDLVRQAGMKNLGVVLDAFHFFCAGHTAAEFNLLRAQEPIAMVHLSDGAPHRLPSEQVDLDRRLPGATGMIDCGALMERLAALGYDGPVIPEAYDPAMEGRPFSESLRHADDALHRIWPRRRVS